VPEQTGPRMNALSQALSSNDLTDDEAKALTAFLEMYRRGKLD